MKTFRLLLHVPLLALLCTELMAQPGSPDASFNIGWGATGDFGAYVNAVALQTDGQIVIAGHFTHFNSAPSSCIARLHSDGTLDQSFVASIRAQETNGTQFVRALVIQPDGWILAGGPFQTVNGEARSSLVRLKPDGTIDEDFASFGWAGGFGIYSLALQQDKSILVAGYMDEGYAGTERTLLRLQPNGQVDDSFIPPIQTNGVVMAVKCAPDGRIPFVLATWNNPPNTLGRILTDGSIDATFNPAFNVPSSATNLQIQAIDVQFTNKLLVSYVVQLTNNQTVGFLQRLNEDGSLDGSFSAISGTNLTCDAFTLLQDGNILMSGYGLDVNGSPISFLNKLDPNGNLLVAYSAIAAFNTVTPQPDGKLLVTSTAGVILTPDGGSLNIARLNGEGTPVFANQPISITTAQGSNAVFSATATASVQFTYQWLKNGVILQGATNQILQLGGVRAGDAGEYMLLASNIFGVVASQGADLTILPQSGSPGSVDGSFTASTNIGSVYAIALQADGKILVGEESGPSGRSVDRLNLDGTLDPAFISPTGPTRTTRFLGLYADGRVAEGGWYGTFYPGYISACAQGFVGRLTSTGSLDSSFGASVGACGAVFNGVLQPNGQLVISGAFTNVNQTTLNALARLNLDSTLDTTFNPPLFSGDRAQAVLLQPDGKILLAGDDVSVLRNGYLWDSNLLRLGSDGSADPQFPPLDYATGEIEYIDGQIHAMALQNDGRMLIAGSFKQVQGINCLGVARLNPDGTVDQTFHANTGYYDSVLSLALQSNGKILIGGFFSHVNHIPRNNIAQLNPDGSVDTSFNPGYGPNFSVWSIAISPDGSILCGGSSPGLVRFYGGESNAVAYIPNITQQPANITAAPDATATFTLSAVGVPPLYFQWQKNSVDLNGETNVVLSLHNLVTADAGSYTAKALNSIGSVTSVVAQLSVQIPAPIFLVQPQSQTNTMGSAVTFSPYVTWASSYQWLSNAVAIPGATNDAFTIQNVQYAAASSYSVMASNQAGVSMSSNAIVTVLPAPVHPDSVDVYFYPGAGADGIVQCMATQSDGKVVLGGLFRHINGVALNGVARLNADGSVDAGFNPGSGADGAIQALAIQNDGKIIVAGSFTRFNMQSCNRIARLLPNGNLDLSSNFGNGADNVIMAMALQADGMIVLGGAFASFNGTILNRLVRLFPDGSLDLGFDTGSGPDGSVDCLAVQSDGRILVGGYFVTVNGYTQNYICRLNSDGSLDMAFGSGAASTGCDGPVRAMAVQSNGLILLGGDFNNVEGLPRKALARLDQQGLIDRTLNTAIIPYGSSSWVDCLTVGLSNKILLGGSFTSVGNTPRSRIAQLGQDGHIDPLFDPGSGANGIVYSLALGQCSRVYIGGSFTSFNSVSRRGVARLYGDVPCADSGLQMPRIGAQTQIAVFTEPGRQYEMFASTNLQTWTDLTNFIGIGSTLWIVDPQKASSSARFYRTLLLP